MLRRFMNGSVSFNGTSLFLMFHNSREWEVLKDVMLVPRRIISFLGSLWEKLSLIRLRDREETFFVRSRVWESVWLDLISRQP